MFCPNFESPFQCRPPTGLKRHLNSLEFLFQKAISSSGSDLTRVCLENEESTGPDNEALYPSLGVYDIYCLLIENRGSKVPFSAATGRCSGHGTLPILQGSISCFRTEQALTSGSTQSTADEMASHRQFFEAFISATLSMTLFLLNSKRKDCPCLGVVEFCPSIIRGPICGRESLYRGALI